MDLDSFLGWGGWAELFLKRQLSLPVSRMWQWCVSRSSSAVVIFASPNTLAHSLKLTINGTLQLAYPVPPLNFGVSNLDTGESPDYTSQINQLVAARGMATIKAFLKREANARNRVLYAGPDGYTTIASLDPAFLLERRKRVLAMVHVFLLVSPYKQHLPFVSQAQASFVKMLEQLRRGSRWGADDGHGRSIATTRRPGAGASGPGGTRGHDFQCPDEVDP